MTEVANDIDAIEINMTFKIGEVNTLFSLLGRLPFNDIQPVIAAIKARADAALANITLPVAEMETAPEAAEDTAQPVAAE
jgi:hypothetical protein